MGNNDSVTAKLPLLLLIIGLIGYLVSSFFWQRQEFQALHTQMDTMRSTLTEQINLQNQQNNQRYLTLLKLSEDLSTLQNHFGELEKSLKTEVQDRTKSDQDNSALLDKMKNQQLDIIKNLTVMEIQVKDLKDKQVNPDIVSRIKQDVEIIRKQLDSHIAKFVTLQEQLLIRSATPSSTGSPVPQTPPPNRGPGYP